MTIELTARQRQLLAFLQAAEATPTAREICEHMGYGPASTQAVYDGLEALERKGYIMRPERSLKSRMPVTILRPLPGVLSTRNKLGLVRDTLERLQRVRVDLLTRGAPAGADVDELLAVADRDALEELGAILAEQPESMVRIGGAS